MIDPQWPRASNWLAGEAESPSLLVVGVPSSKASIGRSRADLAPLEVRERLDRFSTYHGELGVDLGGVPVRDMGNWPVSELDMDELVEGVTDLAADLPSAPLTVYLGGDNAITRPLVAALGDDLSGVGLITFDAHHDVRDLGNGPTSGAPIRGLIEEHGLPGGNVVQIGIHSFANSRPYREYCDAVGITTVTVDQVSRIGMKTAIDVGRRPLCGPPGGGGHGLRRGRPYGRPRPPNPRHDGPPLPHRSRRVGEPPHHPRSYPNLRYVSPNMTQIR